MRRHGTLLSLYRPRPQPEPVRRRDLPTAPPRREAGADGPQRKAA